MSLTALPVCCTALTASVCLTGVAGLLDRIARSTRPATSPGSLSAPASSPRRSRSAVAAAWRPAAPVRRRPTWHGRRRTASRCPSPGESRSRRFAPEPPLRSSVPAREEVAAESPAGAWSAAPGLTEPVRALLRRRLCADRRRLLGRLRHLLHPDAGADARDQQGGSGGGLPPPARELVGEHRQVRGERGAATARGRRRRVGAAPEAFEDRERQEAGDARGDPLAHGRAREQPAVQPGGQRLAPAGLAVREVTGEAARVARAQPASRPRSR